MVSLGSVSALWFSLERGFSPFRKESFPGECSRSVAVAPSLQSVRRLFQTKSSMRRRLSGTGCQPHGRIARVRQEAAAEAFTAFEKAVADP